MLLHTDLAQASCRVTRQQALDLTCLPLRLEKNREKNPHKKKEKKRFFSKFLTADDIQIYIQKITQHSKGYDTYGAEYSDKSLLLFPFL